MLTLLLLLSLFEICKLFFFSYSFLLNLVSTNKFQQNWLDLPSHQRKLKTFCRLKDVSSNHHVIDGVISRNVLWLDPGLKNVRPERKETIMDLEKVKFSEIPKIYQGF